MSESNVTLCKEIRHVPGGYIVEAPWPYGPTVMGHGEVICKTLDEVFQLLEKADINPIHENV